MIDGAPAAATVTADDQGAWSFTPTGLADGEHTIVASQTDSLGNTGTASLSFTLDTTAPSGAMPNPIAASDTGSSNNDNITAATSPTFAVKLNPSVVAGDTVQLLLDGSPLVHPAMHVVAAADVTAGNVSLTVTAGDLGVDGSKQVSAQFSDVAGNSSTTQALSLMLDTTAPATPAIASVTDDALTGTGTLTSGGSTNDTDLTVRVSLNGINAVAGDTIQLYNGTGTSSQVGTSHTITSGDISNGLADVQTGALSNGTTYTITARITDHAGNQSNASDSFVITEGNSAPVTTPVTLAAIAEDSGARLITQAELLANATDVDGPSLSAINLAISSGNGTLVNNLNGTWSYTPAANDDTAVTFSYAVSDGVAAPVATTANLDITPVNDAPVTTPVTLVAIAEDSGARLITQAELLANATDVDGPSLSTINLAISSGNGTLVNNLNGTWSYTPAANDDTAVTFSYAVSDGVAAPVATSATLDITPANDAPVTTPVTLVAIAEDSGPRLITQAELLVNATDLDGPSLTAINLAIASGLGTLVNNGNGTWSYTPAANDDTAVTFSYAVTDGIAAPVTTSATLDITPVSETNLPPVTTPVTLVAIAEDSGPRLITQAELLVNASDVDGPSLSAINLAISSGNGTLVNNLNGTWSYTPAANDDTAVTFSYAVTDGVAAPVTTSATLDIAPVNDAPVATPVTLAAIAEDSGPRLITQAELLANATDVDGPSLTAVNLAISSGNGTLVNNGNGTWSYTPAANDGTAVTFSYAVTDGVAAPVATTASLDITPVNDAPVTIPVTLAAIAEDSGPRLITQAELLTNASDVDGPSLTAVNLAISSGNGTLVNNLNGTWSYTPAANDGTAVTFSYAVTDGVAAPVATTASLDITPVNDAPVTTPVTLAAIAEDSGPRLITQAELLVNASDVDGPSLTAPSTSRSPPAMARWSTTSTAPGATPRPPTTTPR